MNLDEIGPWSEIKLDILRDYAAPYSKILKSNRFHHGYIDAFSGPGLHVRKAGGEEVLGSPLVALEVEPSFDEYHFIDLDGEKVNFLRGQVGDRPDVTFYKADCNQVMLESVIAASCASRLQWTARGLTMSLGETKCPNRGPM